MAKNNNELLANLGNFSNRALKFLASSYSNVVPAYGEGGVANLQQADSEFIGKLQAHSLRYIELMEKLKLKDALRKAMDFSSECNLYFQENKPWEVKKK